MNDPGEAAWASAAAAAALFAVDPQGLGGIVLRASAGPLRDRWADALHALLGSKAPWRRMPVHIADDRLLGGIDLAATLRSGQPLAQRGLLAECDGGVLLVPMAERIAAAIAARLAAMLDTGEIGFERHGLSRRWPARVGVIAFDEGRDDDPPVAPALADRLAFVCDGLDAVAAAQAVDWPVSASRVQAARSRLAAVSLGEPIAAALCATAVRLGVGSLRASLLACRAARAAAALNGHAEVLDDDARLAATLVLAPRATVLPSPPEPDPADPPPPEAQADTPPPEEAPAGGDTQPLEDRLIAAAQAALPAGLLAALARGEVARAGGRVGALSASPRSGRPVGSRAGVPRGGARLNLIDTLRAAAPWQRLRAAAAPTHRVQVRADAGSVATAQEHADAGSAARVQVRAADLRVSRLQQRAATATLFVIDASGSSALHRLAEAKGAVNLLLAECYVRRDQVGVIAFRGRSAEVLLPPTRSLVRAGRCLAGLPGGGGTPLAAGLEAALRMAAQVRRAGAVPVVVLLTDGRANVALDGSPGRARAEADALAMARHIRAARLSTLWVDTSPQPSAAAQQMAAQMAAPYRALPHAGAAQLSAAVRALPRPAF